ncbi:MAG: pyrimidine-nucleoside phosphorylase, partial [Acetatifactor sp.]|nr:pyrimidine-nucleoside phosphorylase [Acetatifactor sp.]
DAVKAGETFAVIHANDQAKAAEAERRFLAACTITAEPPAKAPFIKEIIEQ